MADLQSTDQFLVNRSDSTATVTAANLMATILDDDLMLVNRGDQTYKVTGADVKDSLGTKPIYPEPDEITATPDFQGGTGTELDPFILQTIDVRPGGATGVSGETITIAVAGAEENQPVIWTNNSDQQLTGTRFDQPSGIVAADGTWTGKLVYNDDPHHCRPTTSATCRSVTFTSAGRWAGHRPDAPIEPLTKSPPSQISKVVVERKLIPTFCKRSALPRRRNGQTVEVIISQRRVRSQVTWCVGPITALVLNRFPTRGVVQANGMAGAPCLQRHSRHCSRHGLHRRLANWHHLFSLGC